MHTSNNTVPLSQEQKIKIKTNFAGAFLFVKTRITKSAVDELVCCNTVSVVSLEYLMMMKS